MDVVLGVTAALPKTAVPPTPELSRQYKKSFAQVTAPLKDNPDPESIEEIGKVIVGQVEEIALNNKATLDDFDSTIREVVSTVAAAVSGLKGSGERHESSLTKLADGFDSLARIEDVGELRRRLREDVGRLRQSVDEMRRESESSVRQLEARVSSFQQRLEAARKGSDTDRLTMLGSRRVAERYLQGIPKMGEPVSVLLFDIEGLGKINERYGVLFGDKLLQALAHQLRDSFPMEGPLFRWGNDEFLAIFRGDPGGAVELCQEVCTAFAHSNYTTFVQGEKQKLAAALAWGAAHYHPPESIEGLCLRARENLEQNRRDSLR